jgi:hypothetical protein
VRLNDFLFICKRYLFSGEIVFIKQKYLDQIQYGLSFGGLLLGLIAANSTFEPSSAEAVLPSSSGSGHDQVAAAPTKNPGLKEGIHLYGASPQPGQLRQEYFVFEVKDDHVVGAAYMPRSDFDCFYGNLNNRQLDLTVVSGLGHETYDYNLNLRSYEPIAQISENDERMLATCKADVANTWQAQQ